MRVALRSQHSGFGRFRITNHGALKKVKGAESAFPKFRIKDVYCVSRVTGTPHT
jgi:hypothetical protein